MLPADVPILKEMQGDYPYPDLSEQFQAQRPLEAVRVVVGDDDRPLMAVAAKKLQVELFLWCGDIKRPHAKMYALRLLHEDMSAQLRALGYTECQGFLPPPVAKRFARRLEKSFGWTKSWPSWNKRF
jgi:hypothetical protein